MYADFTVFQFSSLDGGAEEACWRGKNKIYGVVRNKSRHIKKNPWCSSSNSSTNGILPLSSWDWEGLHFTMQVK